MKALLLLFAAVWSAGADDEFAHWWPVFQAAVAHNDAKAVIDGSKFPMHWENGPVRAIKTREDFLARFETYFTPDMRTAVARAKPVRIPEGYMITWKARGNEYSLYLHPSGGGRFALDGLSEGPP